MRAESTKLQLEKSGKYDKPEVTQFVPADTFYEAEGYYQKYFEKKGISHIR